MGRILYLILLISTCGDLYARDPHPSYRPSEAGDKLQMSFLCKGCIYSVQRRVGTPSISTLDWEKKLDVSMGINMYQIPMIETKDLEKHICCFEFEDVYVFCNPGNFLRWRLSSSGVFWGTENTIDDKRSGIFGVPLNTLKPVGLQKVRKSPKKTEVDRINWHESYSFTAGSPQIFKAELRYRGRVEDWSADVEQMKSLPPSERKVLPRVRKDMYFDFSPQQNEKTYLLFLLFHNSCWTFSSSSILDESWLVPSKQFIEVWDHTQMTREKMTGEEKKTPKYILTDLSGPFYAFERKQDYYFVSLSGEIHVAPHVPSDLQRIHRLIAELDSDAFATREKATRELRADGIAAYDILKGYLSKTISLEQKRRITEILGESKGHYSRETKVLWKDAEKPVEKILFDLDKDKVYAFTKSDRQNRIYYFEIQGKPILRLLPRTEEREKLSSIPESAGIFLNYARALRKRQ